MNKNFNKGFTLIELLVVIAIVGILSSVTIVTFSGSQNKAKDGTSKVELAQIKSAAIVYILDRPSWGGFCTTTAEDIVKLRNSIQTRQEAGFLICETSDVPYLLIGFKKREVSDEYICYKINASTKTSEIIDPANADCDMLVN